MVALAWRRPRCLPAVLVLISRCTGQYTLEGLKQAYHAVGVKLAVEEDDTQVMQGLLPFYLNDMKVDLMELCSSASNIYHYADYTPLHYACLLNRDEHIRLLLEAGCPRDLETARGVRPLHAAAREGSDVSARILLQRGADPRHVATEKLVNNNDIPQRGFNGLNAATMAAKAGHLAVLRAIQEHGGLLGRAALQERDLNGEVSEKGWAPVHYAASRGDRDLLRFLTFEVGWNMAEWKDEVVAAAPAANRAEVQALAALEPSGPEFAAAREAYLAELGRRATAEL